MCGIAGLFHYNSRLRANYATVEAMTNAIAHRGPDGVGIYADGPVGLGHRRLAIIDIDGGHQPMADTDERFWIVFNGEIYNYRELRKELLAAGCQFCTNSDTEVILLLYKKYGTRAVERLRGMFAFAIWDRDEQSLFVARDRVGKKPLYYADLGHTFLFASEAKALLTHPDVSRDLNLTALDDYLTYQYVPAPQSMFRAIAKLPPAHFLLIKHGQITIERYWELSFSPKRQLSDEAAVDELRVLLSEAVRLRLISDVPLGAFLSGGIDSSLVVALMATHSSSPVNTFSIGFTDQQYNELPYARMVAERYGTKHQEFVCSPDLVDVLPEMVWHFDEPFADMSAVPTYYLAKLTRQHVTVALNGDGGDEGFAGYERYLGNKYVNAYSAMPEWMRRSLVRPVLNVFPDGSDRVSLVRRMKWLNNASLLPKARQYSPSMTIFRSEDRAGLLTPAVTAQLQGRDSVEYMLRYYQDNRLLDEVDRMLFSDFMTYLPGDLLVKVDRMTMAHGLEGRSPLLDHRILEFAATLPGTQKLRGTTLKYLLKLLAEQYLPRETIYRPKQGFGVPVSRWFRNELRAWVQEILAHPAVVQDGLLQGKAVNRFTQEHMSGRLDHGHRIWAIINLEIWYRMFVRQETVSFSSPLGAPR